MDMDKFINDQLSVWPAACGNFRALRKVVTKRAVVGGLEIVVQHNPARIVSSAAKTDTESLKHRKCFLCRENRPPEQSAIDFEGRKGRKYDILLNPYPIFRNHLVIAMKEHTPQSIWRRYVDMLDLAVALPGYTVFYNGPECGASAPDHHHFQAASRGQMPLESAVDAFFDSCMQPGCSLRQEGAAAPAFQSIASNMDAELFLSLPVPGGRNALQTGVSPRPSPNAMFSCGAGPGSSGQWSFSVPRTGLTIIIRTVRITLR